ncbi:MAG: Ig-like domain-containing protein [Bifidobacteriaceae bacterium]|nr:Ig-like domain-containing protein [Bifidobacteriaceae bacterium]
MRCQRCQAPLAPDATVCPICDLPVAGAEEPLGQAEPFGGRANRRGRPKILTIILIGVIALAVGGGAGFGMTLVTAKSVSAEFAGLDMVGELYAIAPGESAEVTLASQPEKLFLDSLTLESSRPSVLKVVESDGQTKIEGVKSGEVVLTVKSSLREVSKTYSFMVSVVPTAITGLPEDVVLDIDETDDLKAVVEPIESTYPIGYQSSDAAVVSVDADGQLTGLEPGEATVTVSAGAVQRDIAVVVRRKVQAVNLPHSRIELKPGETYQIEPVVEPADATDPALTYSTADPTSAVVSETGLVMAVWDDYSNYSVTIEVASQDGPAAELEVAVTNPYQVNGADGPTAIPGTSFQITTLVFETAAPNCTGFEIDYGVPNASSSAFLNELRNGTFNVMVLDPSGAWSEVGSFSMGGAESYLAAVSFSARTVSQIAVVPAQTSPGEGSWESTYLVQAVVFEGQPTAGQPGDI